MKTIQEIELELNLRLLNKIEEKTRELINYYEDNTLKCKLKLKDIKRAKRTMSNDDIMKALQ